MDDDYKRLHELSTANQREHMNQCRTNHQDPLHNLMWQTNTTTPNPGRNKANFTSTTKPNNNNTIQEDETSAWLQSAMEDPFLRELCSDLFNTNHFIGGPSASLDPVVQLDQPNKAIELGVEEGANEGCGALSSSSAGSGTSGGATGKERRNGSGRKRKGRDQAEESELLSEEENEYQSRDVVRRSRGASSARRSRSAEVHNMSERRRRDRINEKMKALQELIPHCNKTDKASMLDEAIEYLKSLQLQVQMMWMAKGIAPVASTNSRNQSSSYMGRTSSTSRAPTLGSSNLQMPKIEAPAPNQNALARIQSLINGPSRTQGNIADLPPQYLGFQEMSSFATNVSQPMQLNAENIQKWLHR